LTDLPGVLLNGEDEFPGSSHPSAKRYLAEKFWHWIKRGWELARELVKKFQNQDNSSKSENEGPWGRPTIGDNFILGGRNHWCAFFEFNWPDIGWTLLKIRNRRTSTIEDIQKAFQPLRDRPRCDMAIAFLRGSPEKAERAELRKNKIRADELNSKIQEMERDPLDLRMSYIQAENALKESNEENKPAIQQQLDIRRESITDIYLDRVFRLIQHKERLQRTKTEYGELEKKVQNQETFIYCDELLDFLLSRRRALEPRKLGRALTGVPEMGWRQSDERCSDFPEESFVQLPYRIFLAISHVLDRIEWESSEISTDLFQRELLSLPKKHREAQQDLCHAWRDLKLAIAECSQANYERGFMPYAISSAFLRNLQRLKGPIETVLDEQDKLALP